LRVAVPGSAGPLAGVRVIELPALGPIPFLGMLLADLGADVIQVGRPGSGPAPGENADPLGRGRRAITIDLRQVGGAEVVLRLAGTADVLIEGFRPGTAERLGIGPDAALARNPALVYGRLTGFGQDGPLAGSAGHNINFVALTGQLGGTGDADDPPVPPANSLGDFAGGSMFLAVGVLAALLEARASGKGQVIDAAMIDGASYLGSLTRGMADAARRPGQRDRGGSPNYGCYRCADGRYVAVAAVEPKFWAALVRLLGDEPENVPSPYDRGDREQCRRYLTEAFARKTRDEWAEVFEGTDGCVTPVLTLAEAPGHRHNVARGGYVMVDGTAVAAPAPRFSSAGGHRVAGRSVPAGREVLVEAGFSAAEIRRLADDGVAGV
jgi:alpha-methylacyl-CoA racemase